MPAYNGEAFIRQAIESVLQQSYPNWELIVVDDGSTDGTADRVNSIGEPRIRYTYQENRGQAAALNTGLDLARGDYVTTLDVDDWFTKDSLFERVKFLDQNPDFGAVYGDGYYCDLDGKPLQRFSQFRIGDVSGDVYDILIAAPFFGTGGNVLVRREILDRNQIRYDESIIWCQDYDFYIRVAEVAPFGLINTVTIWYRLHDSNMTMSVPSERRLESLMRTKVKVLESARFNSVCVPDRVRFFHNLLIHDLSGRKEDQAQILENPHFRSLPENQQARLLRLVANSYLIAGTHAEYAKGNLKKALVLDPRDPKNIAANILAQLHPGLIKYAVNFWRNLRTRNEPALGSPFDKI